MRGEAQGVESCSIAAGTRSGGVTIGLCIPGTRRPEGESCPSIAVALMMILACMDGVDDPMLDEGAEWLPPLP